MSRAPRRPQHAGHTSNAASLLSSRLPPSRPATQRTRQHLGPSPSRARGSAGALPTQTLPRYLTILNGAPGERSSHFPKPFPGAPAPGHHARSRIAQRNLAGVRPRGALAIRGLARRRRALRQRGCRRGGGVRHTSSPRGVCVPWRRGPARSGYEVGRARSLLCSLRGAAGRS
ncbi:hypothetical protein PsYK624_059610 [Phanerochaete sordida]|uniref:Uncharacterized protein n=1 Tax=Phanerochaete sordida TaxID=48140 RepID=A0A9P3G7V6_9APHY|nr:hypothetical protein PsYK624_059610 [Phanerochaete sordida]